VPIRKALKRGGALLRTLGDFGVLFVLVLVLDFSPVFEDEDKNEDEDEANVTQSPW
jgi:hypothetical protein